MKRMKGIEYSFAPYMIVGLIIFLWVFPATKAAAAEAVKRSAFFQAEDIASKINILQSAPDRTHAFFRMAQGKCDIEINQIYVSYKAEGEEFKSDILQTGNVIERKNFRCDEARRKYICFVKKSGVIVIEEKPSSDCRGV